MASKIQILLIIAAFTLGYMIYPFMLVLISAWFGFFFIYKIKKQDKNLNRKENLVFNIVVFTYPFIEIFLKYFLLNTSLHCYDTLNRYEHFLFAFCLQILLLPVLKPTFIKLSFLESMILSLCLITFIGNLNEIMEFIIRIKLDLLTNAFQEKVYYSDTILDIITNTLGGLVSFFIIINLNKSSEN